MRKSILILAIILTFLTNSVLFAQEHENVELIGRYNLRDYANDVFVV